jgi:hypothetical protein
LSTCENRKDKEGNFTRVRLFVEPSAVPELRDVLNDVHEFFERYNPEKKAPATA